ncbi:hypothetical protein AB0M28_23020 [Streptomyces sp. NPDC051940]|uniref:hypothetical protein n=1 Tax=Streptomyces sp. NPDC051940 TaxID=3155675 RepID=UPI00342523ED
MTIAHADPLRLLAVTHTFAALRLLPMSNRDKDTEALALRHQINIFERQLGAHKPAFRPADRTFLATLLRPCPGPRCATCTFSSNLTLRCTGKTALGRPPNPTPCASPLPPARLAKPTSSTGAELNLSNLMT